MPRAIRSSTWTRFRSARNDSAPPLRPGSTLLSGRGRRLCHRCPGAVHPSRHDDRPRRGDDRLDRRWYRVWVGLLGTIRRGNDHHSHRHRHERGHQGLERLRYRHRERKDVQLHGGDERGAKRRGESRWWSEAGGSSEGRRRSRATDLMARCGGSPGPAVTVSRTNRGTRCSWSRPRRDRTGWCCSRRRDRRASNSAARSS